MHVDLRGTRLIGDVRALLRSLSPIENASVKTTPVHYKHVDTRLVAQAPWHGVVRSLTDWNEVVKAIGQTNDLKASSNNIAPPVDFKTHMVCTYTTLGHYDCLRFSLVLAYFPVFLENQRLALCVRLDSLQTYPFSGGDEVCVCMCWGPDFG